ncbi:hypothetical protein H2248_007236 [Termitomyces sp. 'cryptogamus']|nr:hypothetical protein H2248_007236 [Termitomyces sp. 'cryptogamus']
MDVLYNVIPVLDLLCREGQWLVIMPSWGMLPLEPPLERVHEVFHSIHYLLKGLMFLREHRIAHGDIKTNNCLTWTTPMLAPLLDRMTTRYIERRFKGSEALQSL